MTQLHELSASELLAGYRSRQISPVDALLDVLSHVARWEHHLQATYLLRPRGCAGPGPPERGPLAARRPLRPAGRRAGHPQGQHRHAGRSHTAGHRGAPLVPAAADAPPAARLREAGAVLLAKTTMPDYGMLSSGLSSFIRWRATPGTCPRARAAQRRRAAAAAGYGPLHVGTDIGGLLRLPASWCGIFTLKPSLGRIPIDPPYTGRAAGPMTRGVEDAALMMQVLSQPDARDSMSLPAQPIDWLRLAPGTQRLRGLRLGLLLDAGCGLATDPEVRAAVQAAAQRLADAGAIVEPMELLTRAMLDGMDHFLAHALAHGHAHAHQVLQWC